MSQRHRLVIIGGVAGGASAAARARRLSEHSEIIVLERGPYVSFANCGLPYHIGKIIEDRDDLLVQTPESLKSRFNLDVRVRHEALAIDRQKKEVRVKDLTSGKEFSLAYDTLVLSPGAEPFRPPIPGMNLPNVFTLRTIPDMDKILAWLDSNPVKHATVIGGGFIGLETAENFRHRGLAVTLVEREKQVMPPLDAEMATLLHQHLRFNGVDLRLGFQVSGVAATGKRLTVEFNGADPFETDLVVMSIGVRPEIKLAKEAGLKIGERGIAVDASLHTSDPSILAIGDAIETIDGVTGATVLVPLAGPANRQGRMAADLALTPQKNRSYRGTQGTWICKVFDLAAAQTGASEKTLKRLGKKYQRVYLHPGSHAGYYPGAFPMAIKMLFDPENGRVLGSQIVGRDGVDKRTDVFATAIAAKMTVSDLTHLELSYAPPFGSAKDPVNLAGMIADNIMSGDHLPIQVEELDAMGRDQATLLDVRTVAEHEAGHIPGSINVPVDDLRGRLSEIPRDKEVLIYCQQGLRGYVAQRIMTQEGFRCRNLIGGYKTWGMFHEEALRNSSQPKPLKEAFCSSPTTDVPPEGETFELDACGLQCPGPLLKMRERMEQLKAGQFLKIFATDPGFPNDAAAWANRSGNRLVKTYPEAGRYVAILEKTEAALSPAVSCPTTPRTTAKNQLTMVVFSNDLDRAYATFIIANGAAAMGMKVTLFFTFWGLNILRRKEAPPVDKGVVEKMFGMMMPQGAEALGLSKMHFGGLGTMMMKQVMADKKVAPLPELIEQARKAGVRLVACTMSMDVMGLKKEELFAGVEEGGVAAYLDSAADSSINLFV